MCVLQQAQLLRFVYIEALGVSVETNRHKDKSGKPPVMFNEFRVQGPPTVAKEPVGDKQVTV